MSEQKIREQQQQQRENNNFIRNKMKIITGQRPTEEWAMELEHR